MRQQRADDLQRNAVAVGQRGVGVAELVRGEREADLAPRALDDPVDVGVRQWPPDLPAPQVHEDVIAVQIAVLLVHVVAPQPHQLGRDRDAALGAALAARAPRRARTRRITIRRSHATTSSWRSPSA